MTAIERTHRYRKRPSRRNRAWVQKVRGWPWMGLMVGLCLILAAGSLVTAIWDKEEQVSVATAQTKELADPILELCVQGGAVARALAADGRCALAEQVRAADEPAALPDAPSRAEVAQLVQQEVAKLALPPGQGPTSGQLIEAARSVILAQPELFRGVAGAAPSDVQVAGAVNAWFEANAERLRGQAGTNGENGINGRDGDKGDPCLPSDPACRGPAGQDAPVATSVLLVRDEEGSCVLRVTYDNGTAQDTPANDAVCPPEPVLPP